MWSRSKWVVVAIAAVVATSACASFSERKQPGSPADDDSPAGDGRSATTGADLPTEHSRSPEKVTWRPGQFQQGIQVYWHTGTLPPDRLDQRAEEILDYLVSLGANSIGLTFPIYTDGPTPSKVYAGRETPSPSDLSRVVGLARAWGFRVMIRPLIDEANIMTTPPEWRGSIKPTDVSVWFRSYRRVLAPYVAMAAGKGVEEFVLGAELVSLQREVAEWRRTARMARNFPGRLSYGMNWDLLEPVPFVREYGVDMYPALDLDDDATLGQVSRALSRWLGQHPQSFRQRLTIHEVGIAAQRGVYRQPWLWGTATGDELRFDIQAKWFAAACDAALRAEVQGIYYWMIDSNVDPRSVDPATSPAADFAKRPAEKAISRCFHR